jgi:hypothetical protein
LTPLDVGPVQVCVSKPPGPVASVTFHGYVLRGSLAMVIAHVQLPLKYANADAGDEPPAAPAGAPDAAAISAAVARIFMVLFSRDQAMGGRAHVCRNERNQMRASGGRVRHRVVRGF